MAKTMHKCHICQTETYEKEDQKGRIFHFCSNCQFISLDTRFLISPVEEKARYNQHENDLNNDGYKKWLLKFADEAVKPYVSKNNRILDFGSGPEPVFQTLLSSEGYTVDIYDKYFFDRSFNGPYDMITSIEVIEHIHFPLNVIDQLKKVVIPRGYISIKTAFRPESDRDFLSWWYKEDSTHISFYSRKTFEWIAEYFELSIKKCDDHSIIIFRN